MTGFNTTYKSFYTFHHLIGLKTQETIFVMFVIICNFYKYANPSSQNVSGFEMLKLQHHQKNNNFRLISRISEGQSDLISAFII
jgi:hypothetical protein